MVRLWRIRTSINTLQSRFTPPSGLTPEEKTALLQELQRILNSTEFHSSPRCQEFLRYVVEHTVDGASELLKERNIGVDVFHRSPSYEPNTDAIVRVRATEVRKRLHQYYSRVVPDGGRPHRPRCRILRAGIPLGIKGVGARYRLPANRSHPSPVHAALEMGVLHCRAVVGCSPGFRSGFAIPLARDAAP